MFSSSHDVKKVVISTPTSSITQVPSISKTTETTAILVPPGTTIVHQPFTLANDYFENYGEKAKDLLETNFPRSDHISWSISLMPPIHDSTLSLNSFLSCTDQGLIKRRSNMIFFHPDMKSFLRLSSGDITSIFFSKKDLLFPGLDLDIDGNFPTLDATSKLLSLTTKFRPLGFSSNVEYDIKSGLTTGWFALSQSLQHTATGNQMGIGCKVQFVGDTLKSSNLHATFRRTGIEAVADLTLTNIRGRPSNVGVSLLWSGFGLPFYPRAVELAQKVEHDLENQNTKFSFGVHDRELNAKVRMTSNWLLGLATTHQIANGWLKLTLGFDFDLVKKDSSMSFKLML